MRKTNDLGRDPVFRLVCRLAIPTMLAQLVSVLYSIVDRIYIGNIQGIGDLGPGGGGGVRPHRHPGCPPSPPWWAWAGSPIMAMRMGEGRDREAGRVLSNSFLMLLILSGVLTTLFLLLKEHLLMWFGASDATFGLRQHLPDHLHRGHLLCPHGHRHEQLFDCPGLFRPGHGHGDAGGGAQYRPGPHLYLCAPSGRGRGRPGHRALPDGLLRLRPLLPAAETDAGTPAVGRLLLAHHAAVLAFGLSPFLIIATDSILLIVLNTVLQRYGGPELGIPW